MSLSTSPIQAPEPMRIRGLEMPWNRALNAAADQTETPGAAKALAPWRPQEFLAECVETVSEAGGLMTFVFRRVDGAPLSFRAGQYLNIQFPVHGDGAEPVDRSYSISSAPTQPWTFSVSVKRDPEGLVSSWAHENLRPGMVLDMLGPVGAFHLPDADRRARYLFLAAGAGITPLMSMIRTIHSLPGQSDAVLLYHSAQAGGFAFSQELEYLAAVDSRIKVFWSLGGRETPGGWEWMTGRLTASMLNEVAPDANGRQVFACGPEGYLATAEEILPQVGVDDTSIHIEYFTGGRDTILEYEAELAIASEAAADSPQPVEAELYGPGADYDAGGLGAPLPVEEDADGEAGEAEDEDTEAPIDTSDFETVGEGSLTMSFLQSRLNVRIDPEKRILPVAHEAGIRIRMNCQEGMCGSCKVVKLEGEVDMNHQGGIRAREIEAGKFLPCCSTATTDLVIDA